MLEIIYSFAKRLVFWMIVFLSARALFLIYHVHLLRAENISPVEVMSGFWHAIPLDIATAMYLMLFSFIVTLGYLLIRINVIRILDYIYVFIALLLFFLITCGELGIYEEWRTKLNYKAFIYLKNPEEIYQSAVTITFIVLILIWLFQTSFWFYIFRRYFQIAKNTGRVRVIPFLFFMVFGSGIMFVGLRGGIDQIPINQSKSYYSKYNILNHAAVNSANSFVVSMLENYRFKDDNPFQFFEHEKAVEIVRKIHEVKADTTVSVLTIKRPNIVLILLEGWSADAIESLGGDSGIAPYFKELEKNGILFTRHYASGNRSDQGNVSVLSGFPATPVSSISHVPEKSQKLPNFVKVLKSNGYASSYYFGGQLIYGGLKSYIMSAGFDQVYEMDHFINKYPRGKLGIHDEYMFLEHIEGISDLSEPFFSMIFTVSSHSPYDYPGRTNFQFANLENDYLNSIYYVDRCLENYFKYAQLSPWYKNTLFVLVSDHGHSSQMNHPFGSKEYRKIPLLLYGDVIREDFQGVKIDRISSQNDIAATLLHQLEIPSDEFIWSKNLFNPYSIGFAFYEAGEEVGWVSEEGYFIYRRDFDNYPDQNIYPGKKDQVITEGKAFLQVLFQQYLDY